jgi:hypothetical protein
MSRITDLVVMFFVGCSVALFVFMVFSATDHSSKCKDAGGVSVRGVFKYECINPSMIIEVD